MYVTGHHRGEDQEQRCRRADRQNDAAVARLSGAGRHAAPGGKPTALDRLDAASTASPSEALEGARTRNETAAAELADVA